MARLSNGHTIVNVCCAIYRVSGSTTVIRFDSKSSLPPANEVCEGCVFTGLSTAGVGVGGLCTGSLCPRGVSVQRRGSLSRVGVCQGVSLWGSLSRQGLCQGGCLSRQSLCLGGLCQRGSLCPGRFFVWGSLSRGVSAQGALCRGDSRTVTCGPYASYCNAFLLFLGARRSGVEVREISAVVDLL